MDIRPWDFMLVCFLFCLAPSLTGQRVAPIGTWTSYVSHNNPNALVPFNGRFAAVTDGGLYTFDTLGGPMKSYTKVEGMSSESPSLVHFDEETGYLFIGYRDGLIDFTKDPETGFKYISDIARSQFYTAKTIRAFTSRDHLLYIATDFGIVIYDIDKQETRSAVTKVGTVVTGHPVLDLQIVGDSILAAMGSSGVWRAGLNHPNITSPDAWTEVTGRNGLGNGYGYAMAKAGGYTYIGLGDTLWRRFQGTNSWNVAPYPKEQFNYLGGSDGYLYMMYSNLVRWRDSLGVQGIIFTSSKLVTGYIDSSQVILGDTLEGVYRWFPGDSTQSLLPNGPRNNKVSQLAVGNGTLVVAPEGKAGQSASAETRNGFYTYRKERGWKVYNVGDELNVSDNLYKDFARVYYHPETDRFYLGSWNHGVLEYSDGDITHQWTPANSNLPGSNNVGSPNSLRVSGLVVDRNGVLWACAMLADYNLNALDPVDSTWKNLNVPGLGAIGIIVDDFNNKWIINQDQGLVVYNENGTLNTTADDNVRKITANPGQGGLPNNTVFDIAKDQRGHIWVGTLQGIAVIANPGSVFATNFSDASCPVIEGFCLLRDQRVTAIAVDGANRKWIGTTNGVYLVNPQGNKLLHHYTVDNSPLYNNEIRDIVIDPETGEIFIGTSKGLLSLMGDATEGKEDSDSLYVFPNPVPVDFDGPIAINGSVKDAEVKITTVSGRLVRALVSTGGQTVWDGKDAAGNSLAPGVYLAMVAAKDGNGGGIAKFIVLSRQE